MEVKYTIPKMKIFLNRIRYYKLKVQTLQKVNVDLKTQQEKLSILKHREQNFNYVG